MTMSELTLLAILFLATPVLSILGMLAMAAWIESKQGGNNEARVSS